MKKKIIKGITEMIEGKMTVIASDEEPDRVGDSLMVKDWDLANFKRNPVLQAGHDYRPQFTIGIAENIRIEGKKLLFEPKFHTITPLAREIKEMFDQGFLKAWSVGFIPGEANELLEVSAVAVPANPRALVMEKGLQGDEADEMEGKLNKIFSIADGKEDVEIKENEEAQIKEFIQKSIDEPIEAKKKPCGGKKEMEEPEKEEEIPEEKSIERWNKQLPNIFNKGIEMKDFDIESLPSKASSKDYEIYSQYLNCKVKKIYMNGFTIPSPMLGSYLKAFKETLKEYSLIDERNFSYGGEQPLVYETIQLKKDLSEDFLIEGTQFFTAEGVKFIVRFQPSWFGLNVDVVSSTENREWNKSYLSDVHKYAEENNQLKGEAFALSGEFLDRNNDSWEDVVLPKEISEPIQKAISQLQKNGKESKSRGLMFVGTPGTGKTKTGKVMLNECRDASFIWISSKDFAKVGPVMAMKIGFELARKIAPSILFMEDIDKWIKDYTVDLMKTELDGLKENKGMITILTSNNPEEFPDALLDRPGRFSEVLDFPLPTKELRKEMLKKWVELEDGEQLDQLVEKTEGFSGSHMKELVDYAQMVAEDDGIGIAEALGKSLEKISAQRELVNSLKEKRKGMEDTIIKVGRVISDKNRKTIEEAISASKAAAAALEKLISDTSVQGSDEPEKESPKKAEGGSDKGREPKKAQKGSSPDDLAVRALKLIAKDVNFALNQHNQSNK